MKTLILPAALIVAVAAFLAYRRFLKPHIARGVRKPELWDEVTQEQESQVNKVLLSVSRPIATLPRIQDLSDRDDLKSVQLKMLAGGGTFGNSLEVFIALQTLTLLLGVSAALAGIAGLMHPIMALLFAFGISLYPYDTVRRRAAKRGQEVDDNLPVFTRFLTLAMGSGMNVMTALEFTSERVDGPISEEIDKLMLTRRSRLMNDEDAFTLSALSLGTPLAYQFMITLLKASKEGTKAVEALKSQSQAVTDAVYERKRAQNKKLEGKVTGLYFMHSMPLTMASGLLPAINSFMQM